MASTGYIEGLFNTLPSDLRRVFVAFVREAFGSLRFGAPSSSAVACENFGGNLVPFTTSSVANREVAVEHRLGRVPRWILVGLDPNTVNSTVPVLTVSRAGDVTFIYLKSATTSASCVAYVE